MRWEDVLAFIFGPVSLLAIIMGANKALKNGTSPEAARQAGANPAALPYTGSAEEPAGWLGLLFIVLAMTALAIFANRRAIAFEMDACLKRIAKTKPGFKKAKARRAHHAEKQDTLYYETAIRLCAMIVASEGQPAPQSLAVLKRVFNLSDEICPNADTLYEDALDHPQKRSQIIKRFIATYGLKSAKGETLIFGMSSIAISDGTISERSLGLIRMTGDALGLLPGATSRLLMSAGYFGTGGSSSGQQSQSSTQQARSGPPTERLKHLQTLGLTTTADQARIKRTWRHLAKRYHPDKLASQNLSLEELEKTETLMQSINEAYDWLKAHG